MTPKPSIRLAQAADKPAWLRLRQSLWPECPAHKHALEMRQLLGSDGAVFLAETDQVIGFAEVSVRHDHVEGASISPVPYLEGWFVQEAFRGQGVGRLLLEAVERWATSRGYTELASDAELDNSVSIRLHHRLGFDEIGRNVSFLKRLKPGRH